MLTSSCSLAGLAAHGAEVRLARAQAALRVACQLQQLLEADVRHTGAENSAARDIQGGGHEQRVALVAAGKGSREGGWKRTGVILTFEDLRLCSNANQQA